MNGDSGKMDAKKAATLRIAHRKIANNLAAEVPGLIANKASLPPKKLEMVRIQLFETLTAIRKFDEIIENAVCDEKDGDVLKEIEETKNINGEFHRALLILDDELRQNIHDAATSNASTERVVRPKLRKLTLRKFDGDPKGWMEFWDSFEGTIDKNPDISDRDKFEYLKDSLAGQAKITVAGFKMTEANYKQAITMLKDRFGRPDEISRAHYEEMQKLQPVFSDKDIGRVRKLYDEVEFHHRALQALGKSQDQYSDVFVPMIETKLPENIRVSVLSQKKGSWNMDQLLEVLSTEINIREISKPTYARKENESQKRWTATASALLVEGEKKLCIFCYKDGHKSEECEKVVSTKARKEVIRKYGRCYKCLKRNHRANECRSSIKCTKCSQGHHVSICENGKESEIVSPGLHVKDGGSNAMQTAQAVIHTEGGKSRVRCRILFDSGSQRSFIRSTIVEMLGGKPKQKEWLTLSGFGEEEPKQRCCNIHEIQVKSVQGNNVVKMKVTEVPVISKGLRNKHVEKVQCEYKHLEGLWFSDVSEKEHLEIDILVGADHLWEFQTGSIIRGELGEPVAIETKLGYVLSGPMKCVQREPISIQLCLTNESLEEKVQKLWDLETIGIKEEDPIHETLIDEISFNGERYKVKLPWKEKDAKLPSNHNLAMERLKGQFKRLKRDPKIMEEYDKIIRDQEREGIVEKVPEGEIKKEGSKVHYLPHQAVIRQNVETTKVRIVYDASAKESKRSLSLNDSLHIGPPLTPQMYDVLLRMRCYDVALIGDIQKAFLSIEVDEEDRDSLRFIWVDDIRTDTIRPVIYRSKRVIFGAGPSPFLLNATIRHHVEKYESEDPKFTEKMKRSFFVDDLVTGARNIEEAFDLYKKAQSRMAEGGFVMRKWKSDKCQLEELIETDLESENIQNDKATDIKVEQAKEPQGKLEKVVSNSDKVLGVKWDKSRDKIKIDTEKFVEEVTEKEPEKVTKRLVLSVIAKLFDPLGIISPVLIDAKILLQELCKLKIDWDEDLPDHVKVLWSKWIESLKIAKSIEVERSVLKELTGEITKIAIHGFSDASQKAYCAAIYLAVYTESRCQVHLLTSKTRVTPIKEMSIPRLELTAARILAKLMETVKKALEKTIEIHETHLWTDSMTTLYWIMNRGEWKIYVANRVKEILSKTEKSTWNHIPGKDNPADLGSRGVKAAELKANELWWHGPEWLPYKDQWPERTEIQKAEDCKAEENKEKEQILLLNETNSQERKPLVDVTRYSSVRKAIRVIAYILRFQTNVKAGLEKRARTKGRLTVAELKEAENILIKEAQEEMKRDKGYKKVARELGVKEDTDGLLKCYGRLGNTEISEEAKQPILLPKYHPLSELYILRAHTRTRHGGVRDTLAELRSQFWIPQARQQVRKIRKKCCICRRYEGQSYHVPVTAELPEFRVKQSRPFSHVGVDFAGPMFVKQGKGASKKVYLCLFTCAVTRAVHLEIVEDLSMVEFLLCLRRFSGRRGMPSLIVSDNAKTFKAAAKFLRKLMKDDDIMTYLEDNSIVWKFNLSRAPWWGGFFERMIGCVKRCLKKILGNSRLSLVELQTVMSEIEGTVNNRPLTYDYSEFGEDMITPAHLIYGYRFDNIPDEVKDEEDEKDLHRRLRYIANKRRHYGRRWHREYLLDLREHHKKIQKKNGSQLIKDGDVVIVFDESLPRGKWKLGHVTKLIVGKDDHIRGAVIDVVTGKGRLTQLERPVQKLYPLEVNYNYRDEQVRGNSITLPERPGRRTAAIDADWRRRVLDQMD